MISSKKIAKIPAQLIGLRVWLGLSQRELGQQLGYGKRGAESTIARWEKQGYKNVGFKKVLEVYIVLEREIKIQSGINESRSFEDRLSEFLKNF